MRTLLRAALWAGIGTLTLATLGAAAAAGAYFYIVPTLPSIEVLKDVQLQVPLRVYSDDGLLIAEYGDMRRTPLKYEQIPQPMIQAVLAAEDDRFFEHPGVDYQGILRAVIHLVRTGEKGQGGSTITMQVARNFFLSPEKTYLRKLSEIFLALKIERELTKQEILELYLNKIFLGQRAYGVGAAAQVYYGRELATLNPAQFAMIAGLPKAPSAYNPVVNPERALERRNYVLRRMHELRYLDTADYEHWRAEPVTASRHAAAVETDAPYLGEMVRAELVARFGEAAYTAGYRVITTVPSRLQTAANRALHAALRDYDVRHGYRGPEAHVALPEQAEPGSLGALLSPYSDVGGLVPAVVTAVEGQTASLYTRTGLVQLPWGGMAWARRYQDDNTAGPEPTTAAEVLAPGDVVRLARDEEGGWVLAQVPAVAGGLVALHPDDGAVLALIGGFDFYQSKFNRVTQAERQPGSSFKPFIYSAALANGFTPASIINDAPVVFEDTELESEWRPENYSGHFYGPTRLREALVRSRNLVSIRLLRSIGIGTAIRYVANFGFEPARLSRDLSLALGSAPVTPLALVRGFAAFANGGFRVDPYFIRRIEDLQGNVLFEAAPAVACLPCEQQPAAVEAPPVVADQPAPPAPNLAPRVADARNIYLITSMMQDVVKRGTGRGALKLGRTDLAGKTGTTNEQRDAWFTGFNRDVVATAWVGFDVPRPLGNAETGARAALPMWVQFMGEALRGLPNRTLEQPAGLVSVRIDPETGLLASAENPEGIFETFFAENVPLQEQRDTVVDSGLAKDAPGAVVTEQLF